MKFSYRLLLALLLFYNVTNACTLHDKYNVAERSLLSHDVVEGEVVAKESVWLKGEQRIITIHKILIKQNFKKAEGGIVHLITNGGIIGDEWHHSSAELELEIGEKGIFFLAEQKHYQLEKQLALKGCYAHFGKTSFISMQQNHTNLNELDKLPYSKQAIYEQLPNPKYSEKNKKDTHNTANKSNASIVIDCFYPDVISGGTGDTLTIEGSGFETFGSGSMVLFSSTNTGGADFTSIPLILLPSWTDTQIKVIVPQNAGTGNIKIYTANNQSLESDTELYIPYSLKTSNSDHQPSYLIDKNNQGGYTLTMGANLATVANAPFLRALNTLREEVGFNISVDLNTTTITQPGNDGVDVISFDSAAFPLNSVGIAYSQFRRCGNGWEVAGFDLFFQTANTNGINWNFETTPPLFNELDFESVVLHELLHCFQIGHNNHPESVLYFSSTYGQVKRELNGCNDLLAADAINERSLTYIPTCSGHNPYYPYNDFYKVAIGQLECPSPGLSCEKEIVSSFKAKVFLEGFCIGDQTMQSNYMLNGILPYFQPFNKAPWNYSGGESVLVASFSLLDMVDWLMIEIYGENDPSVMTDRKAVALLKDGSIVEANGNTDITFENIPTDQNYFINIIHASHLTIRNKNALDISNQSFLDFTVSANTTLGNVIAQLQDGSYGMYSGDFDNNGIVNNLDYNMWANNSAAVQLYSSIDADGNSLINNLDYNYWATNRSKLSPAVYVE